MSNARTPVTVNVYRDGVRRTSFIKMRVVYLEKKTGLLFIRNTNGGKSYLDRYGEVRRDEKTVQTLRGNDLLTRFVRKP